MNMGGWIGVVVVRLKGAKEANVVVLDDLGWRVCFDVVSFVENALREIDIEAGIDADAGADDATKRCPTEALKLIIQLFCCNIILGLHIKKPSTHHVMTYALQPA